MFKLNVLLEFIFYKKKQKTNEYINENLTLEYVYGNINKVRNQSWDFGAFFHVLINIPINHIMQRTVTNTYIIFF